MTFGSANFGETCEIQVLWYFTRAVCRFMQSNEVIVSHEAELLCYDWIEEAKNQSALAHIKTADFWVNSALFQKAILAYNILRWMALFSGNKILKHWEGAIE